MHFLISSLGASALGAAMMSLLQGPVSTPPIMTKVAWLCQSILSMIRLSMVMRMVTAVSHLSCDGLLCMVLGDSGNWVLS